MEGGNVEGGLKRRGAGRRVKGRLSRWERQSCGFGLEDVHYQEGAAGFREEWKR